MSDFNEFVEVCRQGDTTKVRKLINCYSDEFPKTCGQKLLGESIRNGDTDIVKVLLENGVDVNFHTGIMTHLMSAVVNGQVEITKLLVDKGANINEVTVYGTALFHSNDVMISTILLNNGAHIDFQLKDYSMASPLIRASSIENYDLVKLLVERGANVNLKNAYKKTAYDIAKNCPEIMFLLESNMGKINHQDESGRTILMDACEKRNEKYVLFLLDKGADLNIKNNQGKSAYDILKRKRSLTPGLQALKEKLILDLEINCECGNQIGL